jgi:hypothetical protein
MNVRHILAFMIMDHGFGVGVKVLCTYLYIYGQTASDCIIGSDEYSVFRLFRPTASYCEAGKPLVSDIYGFIYHALYLYIRTKRLLHRL